MGGIFLKTSHSFDKEVKEKIGDIGPIQKLHIWSKLCSGQFFRRLVKIRQQEKMVCAMKLVMKIKKVDLPF